MSKVKIKQVRSSIDRSQKQKRTLKALGLTKINATVEHDWNDTIKGMIFKVSHLVEVEEVGPEQETPKSANTQTEAPKMAAVAAEAVVATETVVQEEEE